MRHYISLFIDLKKAYDSVRMEVLYNILTEFGVAMKLVRLIKICLNELYNRVRLGAHLPDNFPVQNGHHCFSTLHYYMRLGRSRKTR
jgi:hypothetical protein